MRWVVMDIGRIECGERSRLVGLFDTEVGAREAVAEIAKRVGVEREEALAGEGFSYFVGGQRQVQVFDASAPDGSDAT